MSIAIVAVAVAFGLVELRSELSPTPYLNDASVHEEMVRFAMARLREGHLPLESWFPFLGLGSAHFLHYQSLGATLVAALGIVFGANRTFVWSLYLLLALWPIVVYSSARLFRLGRLTAALAAVCSPLVASVLQLGYEPASYLSIGYGVWAQEVAMWALPLAWGLSFRAVTAGEHRRLAAIALAATIALHFETGYLALACLPVWVLCSRREVVRRVWRAGTVAIGGLALAAWVVLPLITFAPWAFRNEFFQSTPTADSYGARRVISWLVEGQLFDHGRWPVLTVLVAIGVLVCLTRARRDERSRALLGIFALCLLLFCGRPTLGPLLDLLPAARDLFLRRFLIGVHLAGLLLAGIGARWLLRAVTVVTTSLTARWTGPFAHTRRRPLIGGAIAVVLGLVLLAPAWSEIASFDRLDAAAIGADRREGTTSGRQIDVLIAKIQRLGGGRTYAGLPTNWGATFTVGDVSVFKYLASKDVDEVGYTLRTESLMSGPEEYFNEANPGDYPMFGVRYLLLPANRPPPILARFLRSSGPFALYEVPGVSYVQVVDTVGSIREDRTDAGARTESFVVNTRSDPDRYPTVAFDGRKAAAASAASTGPTDSPGSVTAESDDLADGLVRVRVDNKRSAVVLLSASYDPGWTVEVDGRPASTEMVAPALVGVRVGAGTHRVVFSYRADGQYPLLFGLSGVTFVALAIAPAYRRRVGGLRRRRGMRRHGP